jgi:hypothetical protein
VKRNRLLLCSSLIVWMVGIIGVSYAPEADPVPAPEATATESVPGDALAVAPPPFSEGVFPCTQCHLETDVVDKTPREIALHNDGIFEHDSANRWCLDCHDTQQRDFLHLADGRLIPFEESYKLCGQCHGTQLRDWRAGDHGKRTGSWSGAKQYMLCAHCHNPHSPHFKPIEPLPPPTRQELLR